MLEDAEHEAEKIRRLYRLKLHHITQMDHGARQLLLRNTERECEAEVRDLRNKLLGRTEKEFDGGILSGVIGFHAAHYLAADE